MPKDHKHRRAVLHLGLPKCGSSALQIRLAASAGRLRDHGGFYPIHRPEGPRSVSMGHMALAIDLAQAKGGASPMLADYLDQFEHSGARTLILSSESLAARVRMIRNATVAPLNAFDLDLALFTRRADAYAVSSYKHLVRRNRHTGSFADFVADSEREGTLHQGMNVPRVMISAKRLFPGAKFHLFDLDAAGGDSISLFAGLTGMPLTEWSTEPRPDTKSRNAVLMRAGRAVNQSHSDEKTLYLLACNRSTLSDQAVAKIDYALLFVPDADPDPRRLLSASESQRLLAASRKHNRPVETEFETPLTHYAPMTIPDEGRTALTADEADAITQGLAPHLPPELVDLLGELRF